MGKRVIIVMDANELAHLLQHVDQPVSCPLTIDLLRLLGSAQTSTDTWCTMVTPGDVPWDTQVLPGVGRIMVSPPREGDPE